MLCVKRKTTQQETAAESTPQAMGAFILSSRGSPGRSVHTSTGLSCSSKGWAGSSSGHGRGIPLPEVMVQGVSVPEALEYKAKLLLADGVTDVTWLDDVASVTVPLETLVRKLSEEQEAARTTGVTMENRGGFGTILKNDRHYIPMKITNVGKGCAINTRITIKSTIKTAVAASISISIPVGGEVYTGLLFYVDEKLSGKYDYGIQYRDIYGNQYEHHKPITITVDRKNCGIQIAEDTTHVLIKEAALNADS